MTTCLQIVNQSIFSLHASIVEHPRPSMALFGAPTPTTVHFSLSCSCGSRSGFHSDADLDSLPETIQIRISVLRGDVKKLVVNSVYEEVTMTYRNLSYRSDLTFRYMTHKTKFNSDFNLHEKTVKNPVLILSYLFLKITLMP